ncbi:MAG TPA: FAD-dependent oxidoreductase [Actinobacteria bacterium]|nr:FAD-dependent oxidoreductase [Actinomycetota bacterium]
MEHPLRVAMVTSDPELPIEALSLWWDDLPTDLAHADRPSPMADIACDVAIIGAGFTGLWTALWLLRHQPELKVCVFDSQVAGFGASGRNGGWLSALFPVAWERVAQQTNASTAVEFQRSLLRNVDDTLTTLREEGIDARATKGGTITLARTPRQVRKAHRHLAAMTHLGISEVGTWHTAAETHSMVRATSVFGSTVTPHCAAIDPARAVRGLAVAVERRGGIIHEHTSVTTIAPRRLRVSGAHGSHAVEARHIVIATEAFSTALAGRHRRLAPIYSLMLATEPLAPAVWDDIGLAQRQTLTDERGLIIYAQRTADDRLAFGGRGAPYHFGSAIRTRFDRHGSIHQSLHRAMVELLPGVAQATVTHTWGGPIGIARDWWPTIEHDEATGICFAGGYAGDGVGASHLAGRTLADIILRRDTPRRRLPWVAHRSRAWEIEPLRWLGINAVRLAVSATDAVDRRSRASELWNAGVGSSSTQQRGDHQQTPRS